MDIDEIKRHAGQGMRWVGSKLGLGAGNTVTVAENAKDIAQVAAKEGAAGVKEGYSAARTGASAAQPAATDFAAKQAAARTAAQATMSAPAVPSGSPYPSTPFTPQPPTGLASPATPAAGPAISGSAPPGQASPFPPKAGTILKDGVLQAAEAVPEAAKRGMAARIVTGAGKMLLNPYLVAGAAAYGMRNELGAAIGRGAAGVVHGGDGIVDRLKAGWEGMKSGWNDPNQIAPTAPAQPVAAQVGTPVEGPPQTPPGSAPPTPALVPPGVTEGGAVNTMQGLRSAENVATGPYVQPLDGQGAIKFGNRPAVAINAYDPNGNTSQPQTRGGGKDGRLDLRQFFGSRIGSPAGALSALQAYGATSRMAEKGEAAVAKRADLGLRDQANTTELAKIQADMMKTDAANRLAERTRLGEEIKTNETRREKQIERHAIEKAGAPGAANWTGLGAEKPENHKARVALEAAKFRGDFDYTMQAIGKNSETASTRDVQGAMMGDKFRAAIEKSRTSKVANMRDYFGSGNADSRNLLSYFPNAAETTVIPFQGGYTLIDKLGNKISVDEPAGGTFRWFGSNDPVDADMMKFIEPIIKAHQDKQKGLRK